MAQGPSLVDSSAIVMGTMIGILLRRSNLIRPYGRIHSFVCLGILIALGGLTFLPWPSDSVFRIIVLPIMQILAVVWMIVSAS
jgi:hypothetical protein